MNTQTTQRATALSLALVLTLSILGSINLMATSPAPAALVAAIDRPAQHVIVIEGKRAAT